MNRAVYWFATIAQLAAAVAVNAQYLSLPLQHVECSRGVYAVTASNISESGLIVIGGESGRYGVAQVGKGRFQWKCLPSEFTVFGLDCTENLVVLGGEGGSVWIVDGETENRAFLPEPDTVSAVHIGERAIYVATAMGKIWSRALDGGGEWRLEYTARAGLLALNGTRDHVVACGKSGVLVQKHALETDWKEIDLSTMNARNLMLSAVTVTDTVMYVGTSGPSVLRVANNGNVLDEVLVTQPDARVSNDHLGLPERVLSIVVSGSSVWLSGFFVPRNGRIGSLFTSEVGESAYRRVSYLEPFGRAPRSDYIPVLRIEDDTVIAVSAAIGNPITWFRGAIRDTVYQFTSEQNVWEERLRADGTSQGLQSTIVFSLLAHPSGDKLLSTLSNALTGESQESRTFVCTVSPLGNKTAIDTIAQIEARFVLDTVHGEYILGHDYLGFPRCSFDMGATWQRSVVPDSITEMASVWIDGVMLVDTLVLCSSYDTFFVADTGLRRWTMIRLQGGSDTTFINSTVVRVSHSSFVYVRSKYVENELVAQVVCECELRGRDLVVVRETSIPLPGTRTSSAAFFDNGILNVVSTVPADSLPEFLVSYRLCEWRDDDWVCSTMRVRDPDGVNRTRFLSSVRLMSANDHIVVLSNNNSPIVGLGSPRRWQFLQGSIRSKSINHRSAIASGRLYVGGDFHGLFSYELDSVVTSVEENFADTNIEHPSASSDESVCNETPSYYTLNGSRVDATPNTPIIDGVYLVQFCSGLRRLCVFVDGRMIATQAL